MIIKEMIFDNKSELHQSICHVADLYVTNDQGKGEVWINKVSIQRCLIIEESYGIMAASEVQT